MFTKMFHIIHEWFELKKKNTFKNDIDIKIRKIKETHAYFSMQIIPVGMRVAIKKREMK